MPFQQNRYIGVSAAKSVDISIVVLEPDFALRAQLLKKGREELWNQAIV
jgi:hypothetical protein